MFELILNFSDIKDLRNISMVSKYLRKLANNRFKKYLIQLCKHRNIELPDIIDNNYILAYNNLIQDIIFDLRQQGFEDHIIKGFNPEALAIAENLQITDIENIYHNLIMDYPLCIGQTPEILFIALNLQLEFAHILRIYYQHSNDSIWGSACVFSDFDENVNNELNIFESSPGANGKSNIYNLLTMYYESKISGKLSPHICLNKIDEETGKKFSEFQVCLKN